LNVQGNRTRLSLWVATPRTVQIHVQVHGPVGEFARDRRAVFWWMIAKVLTAPRAVPMITPNGPIAFQTSPVARILRSALSRALASSAAKRAMPICRKDGLLTFIANEIRAI